MIEAVGVDMRKWPLLMILLGCQMLLLTGCPPKPLPRDQYLAVEKATQMAMTKVYEGMTKEQAWAIAEQVLWYSDNDIKVTTYFDDGFLADQPWTVYAVFAFINAKDRWWITTSEEEPGKIRVMVMTWLLEHNAVTPGLIPAAPMVNKSNFSTPRIREDGFPSSEDYYVSPHLYRLFFDRFDYFAGLRDTWEPCAKNIDKTTFIYKVGLESGQSPLCYSPDSHDPTKSRPKSAPPGPNPPVRAG
jgi:hypothetical protein